MINHHIHKNIKTVDEKIFILKNFKNFEINYSSYMNKIGFSNIQINLMKYNTNNYTTVMN